MINLSERQKQEAQLEAQEQAKQEQRQTLSEAESGEHLPEDSETVEVEEGRTFTQQDVNSIIRDRLAKVKEQYKQANAEMVARLTGIESGLTERENRLLEAENRFYAVQLIFEAGYDADDERLISLIMGADKADTERKFDDLCRLSLEQPQPRSVGAGKKDVLRDVMGLHGGRP